MYKLYNVKRWGSMAVQMMLEELGVPYENVWMTSEQVKAPEFRDVSPLGYIPALGVAGGDSLFESAAIIAFLATAHPESGLSPPPGTPKFGDFLSWLNFMSTNIYPAVDLAGGHEASLAANPAHARHLEKAGREKLARLFGIVEKRLQHDGPMLMGENYSALDPYLLMLTVWATPSERHVHEEFPAISKLCNAVRQRPRLKAVLDAHEIAVVAA
ncbi:MAG: glutathione S-transferase family protein [Rhodospirillales bacterium]|nr:glutathione S-transferase family protein [Rhodospirillales bacterium]